MCGLFKKFWNFWNSAPMWHLSNVGYVCCLVTCFYFKVLKCLRENERRKRLICGETTPGSSIMTMHQLMQRYWSVISIWEIGKSLPEPGQVSRVTEEAQLCLCWPKSHESVVMHELAHCDGGGTRSCYSTAEVFFSWHFLLDISALWDNTSNSLFAPDVRIHDAQLTQCQKNHQHDFHAHGYQPSRVSQDTPYTHMNN
jgi:hypothetical protein